MCLTVGLSVIHWSDIAGYRAGGSGWGLEWEIGWACLQIFLNFPPNSNSLIQGGREIQNFFNGFLGNFFFFARVGLGGRGEEFSR